MKMETNVGLTAVDYLYIIINGIKILTNIK